MGDRAGRLLVDFADAATSQWTLLGEAAGCLLACETLLSNRSALPSTGPLSCLLSWDVCVFYLAPILLEATGHGEIRCRLTRVSRGARSGGGHWGSNSDQVVLVPSGVYGERPVYGSSSPNPLNLVRCPAFRVPIMDAVYPIGHALGQLLLCLSIPQSESSYVRPGICRRRSGQRWPRIHRNGHRNQVSRSHSLTDCSLHVTTWIVYLCPYTVCSMSVLSLTMQ